MGHLSPWPIDTGGPAGGACALGRSAGWERALTVSHRTYSVTSNGSEIAAAQAFAHGEGRRVVGPVREKTPVSTPIMAFSAYRTGNGHAARRRRPATAGS